MLLSSKGKDEMALKHSRPAANVCSQHLRRSGAAELPTHPKEAEIAQGDSEDDETDGQTDPSIAEGVVKVLMGKTVEEKSGHDGTERCREESHEG